MSQPANTASSTAIRTTVRGMVVNASLAAVKIVTGIIGHSYALIADGIESINDIVASVVILISLKVSTKPPDEDHPYGHGKAEQLGALFSAISLLAAGGIIAFQSAKNLFYRHESPAWFTLPVLLLVIVTKGLLSRYALKKSDETSSSALKGDAWHHQSDAITSAAAFLGITVALIGGRGYEKADDIAALVGCLVIGFNGFSLLRTALHENMDGAAPAELLQQAQRVSSEVNQVRRVEKLRMKKSGLGYHMDLHVQVDGTMSVEEGHRVAHRVKDAIRQSMPQVEDVVTHLEPYSKNKDEMERAVDAAVSSECRKNGVSRPPMAIN